MFGNGIYASSDAFKASEYATRKTDFNDKNYSFFSKFLSGKMEVKLAKAYTEFLKKKGLEKARPGDELRAMAVVQGLVVAWLSFYYFVVLLSFCAWPGGSIHHK